MNNKLIFKDRKKLKRALAVPGWAIVTATQEALGGAFNPTNMAANEALQDRLKGLGYDYSPVSGSYKGVDQGKSFLIYNITPGAALALAKEFNQESVLIPQGLLYQDNTLNEADHSRTLVGKDAESQDFFSKVEGWPAFSMGINFDKRVPFKSLE